MNNGPSYLPGHPAHAASGLYLEETHLADGTEASVAPTSSESAVRSIVMALGVWLGSTAVISAPKPLLALNAALVGLLVCGAVLLRTEARPLSLVLRTLSAWLFASSLVLPAATVFGVWNGIATAVALFAASFAGRELGYRAEPPSFLHP